MNGLYSRCLGCTIAYLIDNPSPQPNSTTFVLSSKMTSPFHQKYSTQTHKIFGNDPTPAMPEAPKQDNERRSSDASVGSDSSFNGRRRVGLNIYFDVLS